MKPETITWPGSLNEGSSTDRVETCLARIAAQDSRLHAVSRVFPEKALTRAERLDRAVAAGEPRKPLHGLPVLVKELIDIEGVPTDFGSHAYATSPAAATAPVLKRLEEAGAILLGTTHMVEFAIGSWGTNHAKGTPWNPADNETHRVPGGSSSGSAVAVAADLARVAIGSDTGGSIRIPASLCGLVGFKPTYGLITCEGVAPLGPTFDTLGPITRSVADARMLAQVMAGVDLSHPPVSISDLRIALAGERALSEMSEDVAAAYAAGLSSLAASGAKIEEIELPLSFVDFQKLNGDIVAYEAYRHLASLVDDPATPLDPHVRKRVLAGRAITPDEYRERLSELSSVRQEFARRFSGFDLLILPGTPICAAPLADVDEDQVPMSRYTRVANCLDLCAISLPLARPAGKLPVGLQLCAPAHSDAFLLAAAASMEPTI
jgi:aspartyl-tRNA(Asn)/glutamyl-tRNA(Gln) amidotransferase subunit A